jgi:hypothetical protein
MAYCGDGSGFWDGSGPDPLGPLRARLAPSLAAAEFVPSDAFRAADLHWLEYRRRSPDGVELLSIFLWPAEERIVAELRRPGHALASLREGRDEPEADPRLDQESEDGAALLALVDQLADDITAWLVGAAPTPSGSAPTAPP